MTELQQMFLFCTFIYYLFKGSLFVVLYVALVIVEKHARQRQEEIRKMLRAKRADEQERWKVAYSLLEKEKETPAVQPLSLTQLFNNPHSFTAYSSVNALDSAPKDKQVSDPRTGKSIKQIGDKELMVDLKKVS